MTAVDVTFSNYVHFAGNDIVTSLEQSELKILRRRDLVAKLGGIGISSIYVMMEKDGFPRPVPLSKRRFVWLEREVDAWLRARIEAARQTAEIDAPAPSPVPSVKKKKLMQRQRLSVDAR